MMLDNKINKIFTISLYILIFVTLIIFGLLLLFNYLSTQNPDWTPVAAGFFQGFKESLNIILGALIALIAGFLITLFTIQLQKIAEKERVILGFYYEIKDLKEILIEIQDSDVVEMSKSLYGQPEFYNQDGLYFVFRKEIFILDTDLVKSLLEFYSNILIIAKWQKIVKKEITTTIDPNSILSSIKKAKDQVVPLFEQLEKETEMKGSNSNKKKGDINVGDGGINNPASHKNTKFSKYFPELKSVIQKKSRLWIIAFFTAIIAPPLIITILQFLVWFKLPAEFTLTYLHLDYSNPNFASMFLSNYIHKVFSYDHLLGNYSGYVVLIVLILIFYYIAIPLLRLQKVLSLDYSDESILVTFFVFFFLLPFSISGFSIIFGKLIGQTGTWGFSGILWAFTAYFIFLLLKVIYDALLTKSIVNSNNRPKELDDNNNIYLGPIKNLDEKLMIFTFISAFFIFFMIYQILSQIGDATINVFGHLGGFTLGLIISIIVATICSTENVKLKAIFLIFLTFSIVIPTVAWRV